METPADIDAYLAAFKQHSLRNPIIEQVITETLRVVRDIWKQVGKIDEIHIELGREMKNPADKRKRMTTQILENENANLRIKALLAEFVNPEYGVENVRPYSPSQQKILRIYEDAVLKGGRTDSGRYRCDIEKNSIPVNYRRNQNSCVINYGWNRNIVHLIPVS